MNLYEETNSKLQQLDYTWNDISWIGSPDLIIPVDRFISVAKNTNYDNGFGSQEIAEDLVIMFKNGTGLERQEYDGSESWLYQEPPQKPKKRANHIVLSCRDSDHKIGWERMIFNQRLATE